VPAGVPSAAAESRDMLGSLDAIASGAVLTQSAAIEPDAIGAAVLLPAWRPSPALLRRTALAVGDGVASVVVVLAVAAISGEQSRNALMLALFAAPLALALNLAAGLYRRDDLRLTSPGLDELPAVFAVCGLFALIAVLFAPAVVGHPLRQMAVTLIWVGQFSLQSAVRASARWTLARTRPIERILVIGESRDVDWIRQRIDTSHVRAEVVAALPVSARDIAELAAVADVSTIAALVEDTLADRVIIAPPQGSTGAVTDLIRVARDAGVAVSLVRGLHELAGTAAEREDCNGLRLVGISRYELSRCARVCKRGTDIAGGGLLLIAAMPLLVLIAVAIKLDSPGPILFRQERVGRDGEHFQILKFRSMVADAEARKAALTRLRRDDGEGMFKLLQDPRVTRVGQLLRGSSLDELPQLFNVLRGDMSLVGPRPLVVDEDSKICGLDRRRLHMRPGMTGPWQVLRSRVSRARMVEVDYQYASSWSLWLDVKILLLTLAHVLRRGNV
jgi:exopolysaccharide biosynthesis polyprenyl glycosylphosphotransferase